MAHRSRLKAAALGGSESASPEKAFALLPAMLAGIGIFPTSQQLALFRIHFDLLLRWNSRINLTAIRDPVEIVERHFAESAFLTKVVELGPGTLVDVGSGAGFPGLPVKVLAPATRVVLVEASQKKAAFLKEVARSMSFPPGSAPLDVLASRIELVKLQASWVVIRAVKPEPTLLALLARLLVPRGTLAIFTGQGDAELVTEAPSKLGFRWAVTKIPGSLRRVILVGLADVPRETIRGGGG